MFRFTVEAYAGCRARVQGCRLLVKAFGFLKTFTKVVGLVD